MAIKEKVFEYVLLIEPYRQDQEQTLAKGLLNSRGENCESLEAVLSPKLILRESTRELP